MINLLGLIEMHSTYGHNNVYHNLAEALLRHYNKLDQLSAGEIAELCNVSPSTLARFFRMMDFPTTASKFPELVGQSKVSYGYEGFYTPNEANTPPQHIIGNYINHFKQALDELESKMSADKLQEFATDLSAAKEVVFIGCPIPQEVWRFQVELVLSGIKSSAFLDPNEQYQSIKQIGEGAVLVYFDHCKAAALQYQETIAQSRSKIAKLAIISNYPQTHKNCDYLFAFDGTQTEQDFLLMNIFMNLLGIAFKQRIGLGKEE